MEAVLTSKGQVTIPKAVRTRLGVDTGDRIEFIDGGDGTFIVRAATQDVRALKGIIARPRKAVTVEEMRAAIARRASGK